MRLIGRRWMGALGVTGTLGVIALVVGAFLPEESSYTASLLANGGTAALLAVPLAYLQLRLTESNAETDRSLERIGTQVEKVSALTRPDSPFAAVGESAREAIERQREHDAQEAVRETEAVKENATYETIYTALDSAFLRDATDIDARTVYSEWTPGEDVKTFFGKLDHELRNRLGRSKTPTLNAGAVLESLTRTIETARRRQADLGDVFRWPVIASVTDHWVLTKEGLTHVEEAKARFKGSDVRREADPAATMVDVPDREELAAAWPLARRCLKASR